MKWRKCLSKVQDQIDQAITDVHDEFKNAEHLEDEIPVMRKDIKSKMQIKG